MSIAVFFSRILGLIRDMVMAAFFGTTYVSDAFNIAFKIPNLLRRLFGEGALSAAFVPIYNEFGIKRGKHYQFNFAINLLSVLSFILLLMTFLGVILAPFIVRIIYPGLNSETTELAIKLCRLMFPYLFFIGLSSTFIAILNSHNKFFITGLSSALLNIGWILFILFGSFILKKQDEGLSFYAAYGVMLGGFLQTIINLPYLKKIGYKFKIILKTKSTAMKMLWHRFIPSMIGIGIREINLIADELIASFLMPGSITALGFGSRLMQLPLGIFGISVGTAVLPEYSRLYTEKKWSGISETLRYSLHLILYILAPITVIMVIGSELFIRLIFQRGVFNETAVYMTQQAFIYYMIGLCFFGLNQVITPLFYAAKDTKTPVIIAAFMVGLNISLNLILMRYMYHAGLALATSITAIVQFIIMIFLIRKRIPELQISSVLKNICKLITILVFIFIVLYSFMRIEWQIENNYILILKTSLFLLISLISLLIGFHLLKPEYYKEILSSILRRIKK